MEPAVAQAMVQAVAMAMAQTVATVVTAGGARRACRYLLQRLRLLHGPPWVPPPPRSASPLDLPPETRLPLGSWASTTKATASSKVAVAELTARGLPFQGKLLGYLLLE